MKLSVRALEARAVGGFAKRSPAERRELARKAGRASQASGRAHRWTAEDARHLVDAQAWRRWRRFKEEQQI